MTHLSSLTDPKPQALQALEVGNLPLSECLQDPTNEAKFRCLIYELVNYMRATNSRQLTITLPEGAETEMADGSDTIVLVQDTHTFIGNQCDC